MIASMEEKLLRSTLVNLLKVGNAHMPFAQAVANFPTEAINRKAPHVSYTFWHLLEHIRISQADILEFITDAHYKDKEWPKDYWPKESDKASKEGWSATIKGFLKDNKALQEIALNKKTDLYAKIPWGSGQTILKELLVVADHNAYHVGEFAILRQVMNTWPRNRK